MFIDHKTLHHYLRRFFVIGVPKLAGQPAKIMEERKYLQTWKKYIPVIRLYLKKSLNEDQQFKLNITDFESAGDRGKAGYTFNLQMENGKVSNNISGSAVARDLFELLKADEVIKAFLQEKSVKISVGKSFMLTIKSGHISKFK
jgi:hypothetical protein